MPTYDYQCRACGSVTEVIHSMLEEGPTVCERCGGELRRVLYPAGIIFKGSGFYRTDSRSGDSMSTAGGGGSSSSKADASSGSSASTPSTDAGTAPPAGGSTKAPESSAT